MVWRCVLKKASLTPPHPVRLEAQIRHFALFRVGKLGFGQAADFQPYFALLPTPLPAPSIMSLWV
jgi:hypothetical protein